MSAERPYIDKEHPKAYRAAVKAASASRTAAHEAGLGDDLIEMVNIRVSQINGCPTCLSVHFPQALKAGVKQSTLDLLPAWREAGVFTKEQKAALGLAESLTVLDPAIDREEVNARGCSSDHGADLGGGVGGHHDQRVQPCLHRKRPSGAEAVGVDPGRRGHR